MVDSHSHSTTETMPSFRASLITLVGTLVLAALDQWKMIRVEQRSVRRGLLLQGVEQSSLSGER